MTAASLQRASGGRFTLGLGTSTPKAVEDLHGTSFDRPVRRAHETISERVDDPFELVDAETVPWEETRLVR